MSLSSVGILDFTILLCAVFEFEFEGRKSWLLSFVNPGNTGVAHRAILNAFTPGFSISKSCRVP